MKNWMRYLALVVLAAVTGGASAITVDGQWNDWFSYGGTSSENWNQSSASGSRLNSNFRFQDDPDDDAVGEKNTGSNDGEGEHHSDGNDEDERECESSNAQDYDIEQIFYYYQDLDSDTYTGGTLYIGMVSGYDPSNSLYRAGDLFVDLGYSGGSASYDLAIATGTESSSRFSDVWSNSGWSTSSVAISSHSGSNPYRVRNTLTGATSYGNAQVDWDLGVGPGSAHNFLEIALGLNGSYEQMIAEGGIGLHWTMGCGNDNINVFDRNPLSSAPIVPEPPINPVPEPATMVLFGMGAGLMAVRKRLSATAK